MPGKGKKATGSAEKVENTSSATPAPEVQKPVEEVKEVAEGQGQPEGGDGQQELDRRFGVVGEGPKRLDREAVKLLKKRVDKNKDPEACVLLSLHFVALNKMAEAWRWMTVAAQAQYPKAIFWMGSFHHQMNNPEDTKKAFGHYKHAADLGFILACANVAQCFEHGEGTQQNFEEAAKYYTIAAVHHNALAQVNLGYMHKEGRGVPQSHAQAQALFMRAAAQNADIALVEAGRYCINGLALETGEVTPEHLKEAAHLYARAAHAGNSEAENLLGMMHWMGKGVPQDSFESLKWLRQAAGKKDPDGVETLDYLLLARAPPVLTEAQLRERSEKTGKQELLDTTWRSSCVKCFKAAKEGEKKYMRCAKCLVAPYCSHECQVDHWPTHKQQCKALTAARSDWKQVRD